MTDINVASFDAQIAALLPDAEASESKAYSEASMGQREMLKNNIAQAYSHFGNASEHVNASKTAKASISSLTAQKAVAQKEAAVAEEREAERLKILDPESKTPKDADKKLKLELSPAVKPQVAVYPGTETVSASGAKVASSSKKAD